MATTYEPIATTTLGSAAASITFSSIAATYTDLRVVLVVLGSGGNSYPLMTFNTDTGTNYSYTIIKGDGTSATSAQASSATKIWFSLNSFGSTTIPMIGTADIFSYANSTYKTVLTTGSSDQNGSGLVERGVGLWRSTSAINQIVLTANTNNFATGTTATLYGIKNA
jgi:hypothetical protein